MRVIPFSPFNRGRGTVPRATTSEILVVKVYPRSLQALTISTSASSENYFSPWAGKPPRLNDITFVVALYTLRPACLYAN